MTKIENWVKQALQGTSVLEVPPSEVRGITSDSRQVGPGSIFVAVGGGAHDGHGFIRAAITAGAVLIVGEKEPSEIFEGGQSSTSSVVPYVCVKNSRLALAQLASEYFGRPSSGLLTIGVTGTSGKTTTTYLLESILKQAGYRVGVIGTVNFRFGTKVYDSTHTTPGPVELQNLLFTMKQEGCNAVVMEVSSHALKQKRTSCVAFDGMIFTNLSPEHLDFHPDMEDYYQAKSALFLELAEYSIQQGKKPVGAVNQEDLYGQRLLAEISSKAQYPAHGFSDPKCEISLVGIRGQFQDVNIDSVLNGAFNVSNIAGVVALARGIGLSPEIISKGISELKGIPGRLERVVNSKGVHVFVDYAHKPDALEKVIQTLQKVKGRGRLITVFGCGGDRDRKKRSVMGRIAVQGSSHVFITSDNPRTENPSAIIQEILKGVEGFSNFTVEVDRKKAIFDAIQFAHSGDLVLIAGKGHETYQILGTQKIHFDDREVVQDALSYAKA